MSKTFMPKEYRLPIPTTKKKADGPLPAIASRITTTLDASACAACPISGLLLPLPGLPSLPGLVLDAYHPLAFNALAILDAEHYWPSLPAEIKAALILAALHALGKLKLEASALAVRAALEAKLEAKQLDTFLTFINEQMRTTRKHYPPLAISAAADDHTLLDYMAKCVDVENTTYALEPLEKVAKVPAFLSSSTQGKALNTECYEAWLELAPFLPASTKEKAKPFIKQLATYPDDALPARLISACRGYLIKDEMCEGFEGEVELLEFELAVNNSRKKAKALGLHKSLFEEEGLGLPPAKVAATKPLSFAEKLAAMRASKGA